MGQTQDRDMYTGKDKQRWKGQAERDTSRQAAAEEEDKTETHTIFIKT